MASGIFKDLTGMRFELLTVQKRVPNKFGKVYWLCKCECGNFTEVRGDSFNQQKPNTRSCGCLQKKAARDTGKKSRKPPGVKILNDLFSNYRRRSKSKGHKWELDKHQFTLLIHGKCHYCGKENSNTATHHRIKEDQLYYNGIDRVNSSLGYSMSNCVTCCNQCNYAKLDFSEKEFYDWINRVYLNLKNKGVI